MGLFNNDNELRDKYGRLPDTPSRRAWGTGIFVFWLFFVLLAFWLVISLFSGHNF